MSKLTIVVLTSEPTGLNVRVLSALARCESIAVKRVILAKKNSPTGIGFIRKKIRKVYKIGILGAILGIWLRKLFVIKSVNVDTICNKLSIPLSKVIFMNSSQTRGLLALDNPSVILSLGNGYLGQDIIELSQQTALNVHLEKLPEYPGARSVIWRIFNGESKSGYSVHIMNSKIDKGKIIGGAEIDIDFRSSLAETVSVTIDKLVKDLELNISKIILNHAKDNYTDRKQPDPSSDIFKSYTTPKLWEMFKIWLIYKQMWKARN